MHNRFAKTALHRSCHAQKICQRVSMFQLIARGHSPSGACLNGLRGHLAEIGIIAAQSPLHARVLADLVRKGDASIPQAGAAALLPLVNQLEHLEAEITKLAKANPGAIALMSIPGIGPVTASPLIAGRRPDTTAPNRLAGLVLDMQLIGRS